MAQPARISKLAVDYLEHLVRVIDGVCEDGVIEPQEGELVRDAAKDALAVAKASNAADALSRAIGRAVSPRQINDLTRLYQMTVDELPPHAA